MATQQTANDPHEQPDGRQALKRRGILAAAGAVVAGIVAKQTSQPVGATSGTGLDGPLVMSSNFGNSPNRASDLTVFTTFASNFNYPALFGVDANVGGATNANLDGLYGTGKGTGVGVIGFTEQTPTGSGLNATGNAAVYGFATNGRTGVVGQSDVASGIGVIGTSTAGIGVKGLSVSGFPIIGGAIGSTNGNAGVLGIGTAGPGVQGQSHGHGLVGTTSATDGQHAALIGSVQPGGNAIALRGSIPAGAGGFAGVFDGPVIVNGSFQVFGSPKSAAVKHPGDGTYRLLYCEESPESWFADYGEAKLVNGKADVKLDADFAALVHADAYHVFLTSHDPDSKGLAIAGRRPDGFAVQEHAGGTSSGTFSYRVVAKRKDIAGERLAKVAAPPPLKPVTPFAVPETPAPKPPAAGSGAKGADPSGGTP